MGFLQGGQWTTQLNSDVNDQNLNMESKKEGLTVGDDSPGLVDFNGHPVQSNDVANNAVESSEIV